MNLAFAKKLNDTATTNPAKLARAWPVWNTYMHMANTTQCMSVLMTPIDVYLANNFNIIEISEFGKV